MLQSKSARVNPKLLLDGEFANQVGLLLRICGFHSDQVWVWVYLHVVFFVRLELGQCIIQCPIRLTRVFLFLFLNIGLNRVAHQYLNSATNLALVNVSY